MKTSFWYRVVNVLSSFSLLIQTFTPFLSVPLSVRAQESLKSDISYSISNKDFKIKLNNSDAGITTGQLEYQLSYKNDSSQNPNQIEVAQGKTDLASSNFEKSIDAATCSTNGTCVVHQAPRGILKMKVGGWTNVKWFSISGETFTVVNEKSDGVLDNITDEENNWLLKGDAPAPTVTPSPIPTVEPTIVPTEAPVTTPTAEPTITVAQTGSVLGANGDEVVQATVVQSDSQAYIDPSIWTDKADYAPTEKVVVSGKNFTPGYVYTIVITSSDSPAINATGSVTAASDGTFTYEYQLDGHYRPNYLVQVKDLSGTVVASVTFTDGSDWPCKNFNCKANDTTGISFVLVDANTHQPITSCTSGATVQATIKSTLSNNTGTSRYAAVLIGDVNQEGSNTNPIYSFNTNGTPGSCAGDTIPSNSQTSAFVGQSFTWTCGKTVTISNLVISWSTSETTCDSFFTNSSCSERGTQCYTGSSITVAGPGKLIVHKIFTDNHSNQGVTINVTNASTNISGSTNINGDAEFEPGNGTFTAHAVEPEGYFESSNNCINVNVTAGQTTNCTITDSPTTGNFSIVKNTVGGNGTFGFTITGPNGYSNNQSITTSSGTGTTGNILVNTGSGYSITESSTSTGWDKTSVQCLDVAGAPIDNSNFAVTSGGTITCTFTNTKKGHLIVQKTTLPSGDPTSFAINISSSNGGVITGGAAGSVTDAIDQDYEVTPGTYSVAETVPTGWEKTGDTCQNVVVAAGETKTCLLTNTKQGSVVVKKIATGGDDTFHYTASTANGANLPTSFDITTTGGAGEVTYNNIQPGDYSVNEVNLGTGWSQTNVICDGLSSNNFTVDPGETVTCVFSNLGQGKIIINKTSVGGDGTFNYDIAGTSASTPSITTVNGTGTTREIVVTAGSGYSVSEQDPGLGWVAGNITCSNDAGQSVSAGDFTVTPGHTITCSVTNTKKATLVVKKTALGGNDTFAFTTSGGLGTGSFNLTTVSGSATETFANIAAGSYGVSEGTLPSGWSLTNATCDNGNNPSAITIDPGTTVTCTFTNTKFPTLTINKICDPANDTGLFNLRIDGVSRKDGAACGGTTGAVVVGVGSHTVDETQGTGTNLSNYTSVIGGACASDGSVYLAAGENKTCTITNTLKRGSITVKKVMDGDTGSFEFTGDAAGTISANNGTITKSNLLPGTYTSTESVAPGWDLSSITCDDGTNGGVASTGNISQRKATFNVEAGENVTCTFTNTKLSSIAGYKYADTDGILATINDQSIIPGWGLTLYECIGSWTPQTCTTQVATTVTDSNGHYAFTGLKPGLYRLIEESRTDWSPVSPSSGIMDVNLGAGANASVDFINHRDTGAIELKKVWLGTGGQTTLNIGTTAGSSDVASQTTGTNGTGPLTTGTKTVNTGTYYLSETSLSDYGSVLGCTDNGNPVDPTNNSILVAKGEVVVCTFTNTRNTGTITVNKIINPASDTGKFNLLIGTTTQATDVGNAGTTGIITVNTGNYTVGETAGTGTTMSDYSSSYDCKDGDATIASGNATTSSLFAVQPGKNIVCTFTNTRLPRLTLVKHVTEDNGGTAGVNDFGLTIDGNAVNSGETKILPLGTHTINEAGLNGYSFESISGAGCPTELGGSVNLNPGDNITCTITNNDNPPSLTLNKILDLKHGGNAVESDWTLKADGGVLGMLTGPGASGDIDVVSGTGFKAGTYYLSETGPTKGYGTSAWSCKVGERTVEMSTTNPSITVNLGDHVVCSITNHSEQAILIIKKVVVDQYDENPPAASSFTIHVTGHGMLVNNLTNQTAADIQGSTIGVEIPIDGGAFSVVEPAVTGFTTTYSNECTQGTIGVGDIITCTVTNTKEAPPTLTLSKFNTTWPNDTSAGNNVEYHLKLTVEDNAMNGIVVTDLMPAGFTYVGGSYHVFKNGVDITGDISEPVYHSPGKWMLGSAQQNDVFELVYTAAIDGSQKPGLYKDLAWAYGCAEGVEGCSVSTGILATAASSGTVDNGLLGVNTFVGTKVNLNKNEQDNPSVNLSSSQGEVLGASTSLPSTGTPNWLFIISLLFTMFGFFLTISGLYQKLALRTAAKLSGFILAALIFMTMTGGVQAADNLFIRLTQPKSPTHSNDFSLSYTTMDLVGGSSMTVKCLKKGPSDGSFSQMGGDINVSAGGNNGLCPFESSMMNNNGTYQFQANAVSANGSATSEIISVDYNTSGPGTPSSYGKDKISNCEYKIHFKTADDGKTAKVEIYRSTNTSFTADGGTRVSTMSIGPNQDGTYNDVVPDCNKTYYYVIRAFDSAGNGSGTIGDSVTTSTTTTSSTTTSGGGAVPIANVTLAAGGQEGNVLGVSEEKSSTGSGESTSSAGIVLAAATEKPTGGLLSWIFGHKKITLGILAVLSLVIFGIIRYAKRRPTTPDQSTFQ